MANEKRSPRHFRIRKSVISTIIFNIIQIFAVIAILLIVLLSDAERLAGFKAELAICAMGVLCCFAALADISQVSNVRRLADQREMLEEANNRMEALNRVLRTQRHDFMNHLTVVSGLIEMGEQDEAAQYIERVYGDIQSVSRALRTDCPAVNALLQAKLSEGEKRGIRIETVILSPWSGLPIHGWELCRVLGNLIDNAMDALSGTPSPFICITLGENLHEYTFSIANNGPRIPDTVHIFEAGFTSKGEGHGLGLSIVRSVLRENGGEIVCSSDDKNTVFCGSFPKKTQKPEA